MRINFFGGPGAGKSTTAAWIFSELKLRQVSVEMVTEYVKAWAIQKRKITEYDQVYIFGKQMQYESRNLSAGIKNIVTDSPPFLSGVYSELYCNDLKIADSIFEIEKSYSKKYQETNIFLKRGDKPYVQEGRYQTYEDAQGIDHLIFDTLRGQGKEFYDFSFSDRQGILDFVLTKIDK